MAVAFAEESFTKAITVNESPIKFVYSIKNSIDFSQRLNEYDNLAGKFENKVVADSPCVMLFTSGSTGVPKGVLLSAFNLITSSNLHRKGVHVGKDDKACLILHFEGGLIE